MFSTLHTPSGVYTLADMRNFGRTKVGQEDAEVWDSKGICVRKCHEHHLMNHLHPSPHFLSFPTISYHLLKGWCPYFLARHMMSFANVIVYNYQYMIDPKVSQMVGHRERREGG